MDADATSLDLTELADRAGVSIRTIRFYIQQGLLTKPDARGPGAHYTEEHLERLLLIKRLQKEHLPLAEIRRALESGAAEVPPARSARDYVRTVLGKPAEFRLEESRTPYGSTSAPAEDAPPTRSQWERITLAPDIELHIRRPLPRVVNKQVERLIDAARDILDEDR
jgi:DNA-binding transcriptional MerR regulator